jgi:beta-phosphoglucomutase
MELRRVLEQLGYEYTAETARKTIDYYDRRTSHGSTLSLITHASVLASMDPRASWERFRVALESDVGDIQGGTTKEGIHLGVMAGTLDLVQRAYLGTEIRDDVLYFNPAAVDELDGLELAMQVRGTPIIVSLHGTELAVRARPHGFTRPITVSVSGVEQELGPGEIVTFRLSDRAASGQASRARRRSSADRRRTSKASSYGGFQGAIFDVDGVLVDSPHEQAWRETLRELMETTWSDIRPQSSWAPDAFTSHVYQEVLAGKPRMSGALAALEYFGVPDPKQRVQEYAERKQRGVVALIEAGDFTAFPDALRLLLDVRDAGLRIATASSSKNTGLMLKRVRLDDFAPDYEFLSAGQTLLDVLDVDISGRTFKRGKPHPEIFLTAARELRLAPQSCFVVEDAPSGIAAAKTGGMAALGIARADDSDLLREAGADLVVSTLDDVGREWLLDRRTARDAGSPTTEVSA